MIQIGMGEYRVRSAPGRMVCLGLGSCIGLVMHDFIAKIGGIAHIMMPGFAGEVPDEGFAETQPARFATAAIQRMADKMMRMGALSRNIKAGIFGGANMFPGIISEGILDMGSRNVAAARSELARLAIRIVAEDVGGNTGRAVTLDLANGEIEVTRMAVDSV